MAEISPVRQPSTFRSRGQLVRIPVVGAWIDGEPRRSASGDVRPVTEAATGLTMTEVAECAAEDVELAVADREDAHAWLRSSFDDRARVMRAIADRLVESARELAVLESANTGKPISDAAAEVVVAAEYFRYYAHPAHFGESSLVPSTEETHVYVRREPYGLVAAIVPWNYPLWNAAMQIAPALAAGNRVIVKPSELTPLSALALAELASSVGLPAGVLSVLPGGPALGRSLVDHPDIPFISFTGGSASGEDVLLRAARRIKPVSVELGGKSPVVIFEDADLAAATQATLSGISSNQGQNCVACTRVVVHRSVLDEVLELLLSKAAQLAIGDPWQPDTQVGCVITPERAASISAAIAEARAAGAEVHGGGAALVSGCRPDVFLRPTFVTGVGPEAPLAQEEVFGPVAVILPFDDEEEAVMLANATRYGLAASVWTRDGVRAQRVAHRVRAGVVWVNSMFESPIWAPSTAWGASGFGVVHGKEHVAAFTRQKLVSMRLDRKAP